MKIETGNVINLSACGPDWVVGFDLGGESGEVVCPVIGWATVAEAHLNDGTTSTAIQPAFLWGDMVWTPTELREHTPGLGSVEIRAREITRALPLGGYALGCPLHDAAPGQDIPGRSCICDA